MDELVDLSLMSMEWQSFLRVTIVLQSRRKTRDECVYVCRYREELGREEVIESNLTESIIECINNEIVLRSITDQSSLFQVVLMIMIMIMIIAKIIIKLMIMIIYS